MYKLIITLLLAVITLGGCASHPETSVDPMTGIKTETLRIGSFPSPMYLRCSEGVMALAVEPPSLQDYQPVAVPNGRVKMEMKIGDTYLKVNAKTFTNSWTNFYTLDSRAIEALVTVDDPNNQVWVRVRHGEADAGAVALGFDTQAKQEAQAFITTCKTGA
ncbi:hypothetical protein BCU93_13525 [Vibrio breoganii]|nr:hypothetical protein BCU93_13525 [Vibrio breoganii]